MRNKLILLILIVFMLALVSCDKVQEEDPTLEANEVIDVNTSNMFEQSDEVTDSSNFTQMKNNIDAKYINIKNGGSYIFEGNYDKTVIVDSNKNVVHIKLKNTKFIIEDFAAIYVKNAKKVIITLEGYNEIVINNSFIFIDENNVDSAIFSKSELVINGTGNLDIDSTGNGICSKDTLKIMNGNIKMYVDNHGIDANDSIRIKNVNLDILARFDGIHCANINDLTLGFIYIENGNFIIKSGSDGISASNYLYIENINLKVSNDTGIAIADTYSKKGIKSTSDLIIKNGNVEIDTIDDAIHSNKSIKILDGIYVLRSDDDGIHADASVIIENGNIEILNSYEGIEAQNVSINNGNISIHSLDDGVNCAGGMDQTENQKPGHGPDQFDKDEDAFIVINNGSLYINANGDGIDSNGYIEINGGNVIIEGPISNGNSSIDYGISASIKNADLISVGSSGMASNFTDSNQGVIMYNTSKSYDSETKIKLLDEKGKVIIEFETTKSFSSIIISNNKIEKDKTYKLVVSTDEYEVTLNSLIYSNGGGMGRPAVPKPR